MRLLAIVGRGCPRLTVMPHPDSKVRKPRHASQLTNALLTCKTCQGPIVGSFLVCICAILEVSEGRDHYFRQCPRHANLRGSSGGRLKQLIMSVVVFQQAAQAVNLAEDQHEQFEQATSQVMVPSSSSMLTKGRDAYKASRAWSQTHLYQP